MPEHGALATGAPGGRGRAAQHGLPPQGGQAAGARPRPALGGAPPPPLRAAPRPQLHSAARVLACNGRIPATARAGRAPGPIAAASCHPGAQAGLATQANPRDHSYATELPHAAAHTHAVVGGPAGARTPPKAGGGGGAAGGLAPAPAPAGALELDGGAGRPGAHRCEPVSRVVLGHAVLPRTRAGAWQRACRRRARPAACNSRPARVAVVTRGVRKAPADRQLACGDDRVAPAGGDGSLGADRRRYGSSAGAVGAATGPMRRLRSEPLSDAEAGEAAWAGAGAERGSAERGGVRREDEAARRAKLANWSWWGFRCGAPGGPAARPCVPLRPRGVRERGAVSPRCCSAAAPRLHLAGHDLSGPVVRCRPCSQSTPQIQPMAFQR